MPDYISATNGRGELLVVPRDIVEAAKPVCETYLYVGPDNCNPVRELGDGQVSVASSAARYNPAFYWLIGTPSLGFNGTQALYVMRVVGALLSSLLIGLAAWSISLWSRSFWPLLGLLVALTPVAIYSTAVAAPNGLEIAAGVALWASLIGLSSPGIAPRVEGVLLRTAIPSAVVLAGVRQLGPLWIVLIVFSTAALLGVRGTVGVFRRHAARFCHRGQSLAG